MVKIAIIGAGQAGLVAAKYVAEEGFDCCVYEQTDKIGGIWNYTEKVGLDENGFLIQSPLYENLRTNLPKECMTYPGFPYPKQKESYIPWEEVQQYIHRFVTHHQILKHIKFNSYVTKIEPWEDTKWKIHVMERISKQTTSFIYDAVMICTGHYNDPFVPIIPGANRFIGGVIHCHSYRNTKPYQNKKVLVIGAGPSGIDISIKLAPVAEKVYLSYRRVTLESVFPPSIIHKPLVKKITETTAIFEDQTEVEVDDIIYCTGYKYSYPFLTEDCGIQVNNKYVYPLYKQIININRPTMGFVGIPSSVCTNAMFDLQVRFFLSTLTGHFRLQSKEHMLTDLENFVSRKKQQGINIETELHQIAKDQETYFTDLADTAGIKRIPQVINKLFQYLGSNMSFDYRYDIIDDETFVVEKLD